MCAVSSAKARLERIKEVVRMEVGRERIMNYVLEER